VAAHRTLVGPERTPVGFGEPGPVVWVGDPHAEVGANSPQELAPAVLDPTEIGPTAIPGIAAHPYAAGKNIIQLTLDKASA
jgi:hypothetical protein